MFLVGFRKNVRSQSFYFCLFCILIGSKFNPTEFVYQNGRENGFVSANMSYAILLAKMGKKGLKTPILGPKMLQST